MTRDLRHFTRLLPTMDCGMRYGRETSTVVRVSIDFSGGMAHREAISFTENGEVNAFYLRSFHRTFR